MSLFASVLYSFTAQRRILLTEALSVTFFSGADVPCHRYVIVCKFHPGTCRKHRETTVTFLEQLKRSDDECPVLSSPNSNVIPQSVKIILTSGHRTFDFPIGSHAKFCQIIRNSTWKNKKFLYSHCNHDTNKLIKFSQSHISLACLQCKHVPCPSIFTKLIIFFCICSAT